MSPTKTFVDMEVNVGSEGKELYNLVKKYSEKSIYMTFFGIGIDFNSDLVNFFSKNS